MIPTIIFLLLTRYRRHQTEKAERLIMLVTKVSRRMLLLILSIAITGLAFSQEKKLEYQIKRNGDVVGNINFNQSSVGNRTTLKLESELKTRFIFTITACTKEETIYDNGILTWSSIYRKTNGSEKANKKIKASGNGYVLYKDNKSETLNKYPIRYNMLSLYSKEPIAVSQVYSDVFEQFITIQKTAEHKYKIVLPDGNSNNYHYQNGMLSKVDISNTFYSACIQLKK